MNSHPYFHIWLIFIHEILLGVHCEELEVQGEGASTHDHYEDAVEADDYEYLDEHALVGLVASLVTLRILVLNDSDSHAQDSFSPDLSGLLDSPHFTRPEVWRDHSAPPELLSGHHSHIAQWRRASSLRLTAENRPDLIAKARQAGLLSAKDEQILAGKS